MPDLSNATPPKTLKDWQNPAERPEVIDELIHGVGEYQTLNCEMLEAHAARPLQPIKHTAARGLPV